MWHLLVSIIAKCFSLNFLLRSWCILLLILSIIIRHKWRPYFNCSSVRWLRYLHLSCGRKLLHRDRSIQKLLSMEELLIVLRRQINLDRDQTAAAIYPKKLTAIECSAISRLTPCIPVVVIHYFWIHILFPSFYFPIPVSRLSWCVGKINALTSNLRTKSRHLRSFGT